MRKFSPLLILTLLVLSSCTTNVPSSDTSSDVLASDSSSYISDSSTSDSSSGSAATSSVDHGELPAYEYRLSPVTATGDVGYVYDGYGEIVKELYRTDYYTDLEDVAAYITVFNDVPDNYFFSTERDGYTQAKKECYSLYGDVCRIFPGPYNRNYDFLPYSTDGKYYEADIGGDGYASSSSWSRGALRVVFALAGIDSYGKDVPVVFYTGDHYDTFIEYKNYYGGWSSEFGNNGQDWSPIATWF